jgi:hypothetical protein
MSCTHRLTGLLKSLSFNSKRLAIIKTFFHAVMKTAIQSVNAPYLSTLVVALTQQVGGLCGQ